MRWNSFLLFNTLGGIVWITLYGLGGYFLGDNVHRLIGPVGSIIFILAVLIITTLLPVLHRNKERLEQQTEQALPVPLNL